MKNIVAFVSCIGDVNDTHTVKFINTLLKYGFEIQTIRCGDMQRSDIKHQRLPDIKANFWPTGSSLINICSAIAQRLRNSFLLFLALFKLKPNIIVATEPDSWVVSVFYKCFAKVKVVGELREVYEDRVDAFPRVLRPFLRWCVKTTLRMCSFCLSEIIHVSQERKNVYSYLALPGKVVVYYPDLQSAPKAEKFNCDKPFIVIHAGSLREKYGANQILEASILLKQRYDDIVFVVLGGVSGPINEQLLKMATECGSVRIINQIPYLEVVQWLLKSDIGINMVLPVDVSHYLAQPRKLYEYLSVGLPVVAANVPTIEAVLSKWKNGKVVDPYSPTEIAQAVEFYYLEHGERKSAGKNAFLSHCQEFNWESQEELFVTIFR